jgi:dihydropyrimidine dehydrogenase (NAD+) subunit PreA
MQECNRAKFDAPVRIDKITELVAKKKPVAPKEIDLSTDLCGVKCENPFFLASSPVASSFEMCCHAFDAGWAGVSYKTISFYQSREVSPRFDALPGEHPFSFCGFKNLEQLSPHSAEENFEIIRRLKERYPEKVIIASIMGRNCDEWTVLARMAEEAGENGFAYGIDLSDGMVKKRVQIWINSG